MTPESLIEQKAQRVCIYIGESDRWRGRSLYMAILESLKAKGLAGATVTRGVAGFGAHSRIHTAAILRLSADLPLKIEVVDTREKIAIALEAITPMVREGLITLEDIEVVRYTHRYLNPLPADKHISEMMTREVITVSGDLSIAAAWERMLEHLVKAMPVINDRGEVVGMLTDEDLLNRAGLQQRLAVAERLDAAILEEELENLRTSPLKVADVMSQPAITAQFDEPLGSAADRMAKNGIKRLPVVDESGKLVGVLSRVDILRQVMAAEPIAEPKAGPKAPRESAPIKVARTVGEVMSPEIPMVHQHAGMAAIVSELLESGSRRLIVVDDEGRPVGLISDADVVTRVGLAHRRGVLEALRRRGKIPASGATAADLMSPGVLTASPDTSLVEAAKQMLAAQRKWLVAVDAQGKALGLLDRQILLRAIAMG